MLPEIAFNLAYKLCLHALAKDSKMSGKTFTRSNNLKQFSFLRPFLNISTVTALHSLYFVKKIYLVIIIPVLKMATHVLKHELPFFKLQ